MRTAVPPFANCVHILHKRMVGVRSKRTTVKMTTGIASAFALLVGGFTAEALLDLAADLPWVARALIFVAVVGGSCYLLWRDSIRPFRKRLHEDAIALMVEHALPVFKTRFIASVQLARAAGMSQPHALVRILLGETAVLAARMDFSNVIKTKKMKRALLYAFLVACVTGSLVYFGKESSMLLFKRAMLFNIPLPHKTNIVTITGDKKVGVGEDFKLDVTASGIIPASGQIIMTTASGQTHQFALDRDQSKPDAFSAVIHSPQESFTYRVTLGDDTSKTYHVTTMVRPSVADVTCKQFYPDYVHLPPVEKSVGDLAVLVGSKLKINAKASTTLKKASLFLAGLDKEVPMKVDARDATQMTGEFEVPAKDLTGFSIHMVSTDGVESGETATYRVDLVPDHPPIVRITYPERREELATEKAKLLLAFEAKDDFGVAKVELHYSIDQGAETTVPLDLGGRTDRTVTRHFDWDLGQVKPVPAVGNVVEFWFTVEDTNVVTGPGIGTSEHFQVKIVTADEKRLDLINRSQDTMSGVKEISTNQADANKILGEGIFAKPK